MHYGTRMRRHARTLFARSRPDHVEDHAWDAVEVSRARLQAAWDAGDLSEAIGKAKPLVEPSRRSSRLQPATLLGDAANFAPLVKRAQQALACQLGADLSQDQNIRAISQAAQTLATSIGPIRNSHGTGHGRDRDPDVVDEMATITVEAHPPWSRWALRRLGHLMADYPNELIAAVNMGTGAQRTARQVACRCARPAA